nr:hypothetical protein Iba_chr11eCG14540 [Ipomoea batatas]
MFKVYSWKCPANSTLHKNIVEQKRTFSRQFGGVQNIPQEVHYMRQLHGIDGRSGQITDDWGVKIATYIDSWDDPHNQFTQSDQSMLVSRPNCNSSMPPTFSSKRQILHGMARFSRTKISDLHELCKHFCDYQASIDGILQKMGKAQFLLSWKRVQRQMGGHKKKCWNTPR